MTTTAYLRISTAAQDEASQRSMISSYQKTNPLIIDEWVADTEHGTVAWQKRQIAGVVARLGEGDTIIVSEISRIARSTLGVLTFLQAAAERGVSVIAVRSGIKLDNSMTSKIVIVMLALAAEIERDLLSERTKAALKARKDAGKAIGRQHGATGKSNKLDGKWMQIEPLLKAKVAKAAIARIMGVSRQTLYAYIDQEYAAKVARADQLVLGH